jgi:DNA uptake protein ComE-like DNA-binding protein
MKKKIIILIILFLIFTSTAVFGILGHWDFGEIKKSLKAIIAPASDFPIVLTPDTSTRELKETDVAEIVFCDINLASNPARNKIIFNEIAWMGTKNSAHDEWIELKNLTNQEINLSDWQILDKDNQIRIIFGLEQSAFISANGFFLLERTNDNSVYNIVADFIYTGGLSNNNEALYLFSPDCQLQDKVLAEPDWLAGDNKNKKSMERGSDFSWHTFSGMGFGTPRTKNSLPLISRLEIKPSEIVKAPEINLLSEREISEELNEAFDEKKSEKEEIEKIEETKKEESVKKECAKNSIEINTASQKELEKLVGIGSVIARRIINERPFFMLDELDRVEDIGPARLQNIKEQGCAYVNKSLVPTNPTSTPVPSPISDTNEQVVISTNLLQNYSFEQGIESDAYNWTESATANATIRSNEQARTDQWSMKQTRITTSYAREFISDPIIIKSNQSYTFGGWYYLVNPKTGEGPERYWAFIEIQWLDENKNLISRYPGRGSRFDIFEQWTKIEITVTAPDKTTFAQLRVRAQRDSETQTTDLHWDDMFIYKK